MSNARTRLCGFRVASLKEREDSAYFTLEGKPSGKDMPPLKVECSAFGDTAGAMKKMRLKPGDWVEAEGVISNYFRKGEFRTSCKVLDLSFMDGGRNSRARTCFIDYKVLGLPDGWENLNFLQFTILEATPIKGKPPIKAVCSAKGEAVKKMTKLKIRNGSRIEVSTVLETFRHNGIIRTSYKVTDLSILADLEYASRKRDAGSYAPEEKTA